MWKSNNEITQAKRPPDGGRLYLRNLNSIGKKNITTSNETHFLADTGKFTR